MHVKGLNSVWYSDYQFDQSHSCDIPYCQKHQFTSSNQYLLTMFHNHMIKTKQKTRDLTIQFFYSFSISINNLKCAESIHMKKIGVTCHISVLGYQGMKLSMIKDCEVPSINLPDMLRKPSSAICFNSSCSGLKGITCQSSDSLRITKTAAKTRSEILVLAIKVPQQLAGNLHDK